MNATVSLSLQVLCQLIGSRAPYSNEANIVVSNLMPVISNQSPPPVQPAALPDGYIAYPEIGVAYKIVLDKVRSSEAREQCNLEGAHLAILDSQRKLEYVQNRTCRSYDCVHSSDWANIHTGIHRMDEKWVAVSTGTTLSNLPWASGYPSNAGDDCAIMEISPTPMSYLHNNYACSRKFFYLCELLIPHDYETQENQMSQISIN